MARAGGISCLHPWSVPLARLSVSGPQDSRLLLGCTAISGCVRATASAAAHAMIHGSGVRFEGFVGVGC